MAKRVYIPKKNISKIEPVNEKITEVVTVEKIEILRESKEKHISIEFQISPLSPSDFCNFKKITGLNKDFLEKKYNTKTYILEKWYEILIKENINN
jgi:hypothetical protein